MSVSTPGCNQLSSPPSPLSVTLPGGLSLSSLPISTDVVLTELNNAQSMLAQLGPALAALKPVFTIIDTVIALKDTVEAVPGLISGDVQTFLDALDRVVAGVATLSGMVPQVSVPIMVRDVIGVVAAMLSAIDTVLDQIVELGADVDALTAAAASAPEPVKTNMLAQAECLSNQADKLLDHSLAGLGPVGSTLTLLQSLMDLVPGLPSLPSLGDATGLGAEELQDLISTLREALEALPI